MLYRIGTQQELAMLPYSLPERVREELLRSTIALDHAYGAGRDYLDVGGYSLIAETREDVEEIKKIVDYDEHPCEWAERIGKDSGYLSALFLLNDDYTVMLFMPISAAPYTLLNDLEEEET